MTNKTNKMNRNKAIAVLGLASILGLASGSLAHAAAVRSDGVFWSSAGSLGQIDSLSTKIATTQRAILSMSGAGTVIARYPVTPSAELATGSGIVHLMANLVDPGDGATLTVSLVKVPVGLLGDAVATEPSSTVLSLSSANGVAGSLSNQCVADATGLYFDFEKNVYYVQAKLTWNGSSQPPQLRAVEIGIYATASCGH